MTETERSEYVPLSCVVVVAAAGVGANSSSATGSRATSIFEFWVFNVQESCVWIRKLRIIPPYGGKSVTQRKSDESSLGRVVM